MANERTININGRVYRRNPDVDRYQIDLKDLGELCMADIPAHSHLEIMGLPKSEEGFEFEVFGLNGGDEGDDEYLEVYGGATITVRNDERSRVVARLRRAFPERNKHGLFPNPHISTELTDKGIQANAFLTLKFKNSPQTLVRDAVAPFLQSFQRLVRPDIRLFICHASEDKPSARELALFMKHLGADVWFDEWEIKVGESIVQKIDDALGSVTHLILLLSRNSVYKHWVKKEFSSALMRQLSNNSITVLPLRLDDSPIPPILADIKYADARAGLRQAFAEIEQALFST